MIKDKFSSLELAKHFVEMDKKGSNLLFLFGNQNHLDDSDTDIEDGPSDNSNQLTVQPDLDINTIPIKESSDPLTLEDHIDIETTPNGKGKYDPFVDVGDGKTVSKAQVLREIERSMFSRIPGSTDRLTRVASGTRFSITLANSNTIKSGSLFGTLLLCVGDPVGTLVVCENHIFLAIVLVNDIVFDLKSCLEIDTDLLTESVVTIQFQICQLTELGYPGDEQITEWRWNRLMEHKVLKTRGAFIQVIDPTIVLETAGEPVYSFQSEELCILAASLLAFIPLEDRSRLPILNKHTDHFPYRSGGQDS